MKEIKSWDIVSIGKLHREISQGKYSERELATKIYEQNNEIETLKQSQKQLVISELERVKELLWNCQDLGNVMDNDKFLSNINQRIKELKGD